MEWIKITLCATFFFFLTHCVLHAPCCPHIEAVHVPMSTLGKMRISVGFLYPCENVFMK